MRRDGGLLSGKIRPLTPALSPEERGRAGGASLGGALRRGGERGDVDPGPGPWFASPSYATPPIPSLSNKDLRSVFAQSLHYNCTASSRRRSRLGRVIPSRLRRTFWAASGVVTQRSRMLRSGRPSRVRAGRTTSPLLILASSSSSVRGASPKPLRCIHCPSVFQSTYAKKHTRMCACTRSLL